MNTFWLNSALNAPQIHSDVDEEMELIHALLDAVDIHQTLTKNSLDLAAAFDLLVAAEYYKSVVHAGWVYCPSDDQPLLLYPYTNICPRCVLQGKFEYHPANKPGSSGIGNATSKLLPLFIKTLLERNGKNVEVRKGTEPVDVFFIDRSTLPVTVFAAEIKASPLVTLPLAVISERMIEMGEGNEVAKHHSPSDLTQLFKTRLFIYVPSTQQVDNVWVGKLYELGIKENPNDKFWSYRGIRQLVADRTFFSDYCSFWYAAFNSYEQKAASSVFWFTNACGQPVPRPDNWKRRSKGQGFESVSDSKSSVGMDRTDDIKKGIYQVLKISAEGKQPFASAQDETSALSEDFNLKVGIISNIHAVRHFEDYLKPLVDIVWTRENSRRIHTVADLDASKPVFNLFDGIITLTKALSRDDWVSSYFSFS